MLGTRPDYQPDQPLVSKAKAGVLAQLDQAVTQQRIVARVVL